MLFGSIHFELLLRIVYYKWLLASSIISANFSRSFHQIFQCLGLNLEFLLAQKKIKSGRDNSNCQSKLPLFDIIRLGIVRNKESILKRAAWHVSLGNDLS